MVIVNVARQDRQRIGTLTENSRPGAGLFAGTAPARNAGARPRGRASILRFECDDTSIRIDPFSTERYPGCEYRGCTKEKARQSPFDPPPVPSSLQARTHWPAAAPSCASQHLVLEKPGCSRQPCGHW